MNTANPIERKPRQERGPFTLNPDFKAEMAYVVIALAVTIGLVVTARLTWAVAWAMVTFFAFGVWRIARTRFR